MHLRSIVVVGIRWWLSVCAMSMCTPTLASADAHDYFRPADGVLICIDRAGHKRSCEIDGGTVRVRADERVFVPVRRGVLLRVRAAPGLRVAYGFGARAESAALVWQNVSETGAGQTVQIPFVSTARYVVFTRATGGEIHVAMATRVDRLLAWERFEADMNAWFDGGDTPDAPDATAERVVRTMRDVRRVFPRASAPWLSRYAERIARRDRARFLGLPAPWYTRVEVERAEHTLESGRVFAQHADEGDVWVVTAHARTPSPTRLEVRRGQALTSAIEWTGQEPHDRDGWTSSSQTARVIVSESEQFELRVVHGEARIRLSRFVPRHRFERALSTMGATPSIETGDDRVLAKVMALDASTAAREALVAMVASEGNTSIPARAFIASELASTAGSVDEAARFARLALASTTDAGASIGSAIRFRVMAHLLDVGATLEEAWCRAAVPAHADDPDYAASEAIRAVLCAPHAVGTAPVGSTTLSEIARARFGDPWLAALATLASREEVSWRTLTLPRAESDSRLHEADDGRADGMCAFRGRAGPRWTVLSPGRHTVDIAATTNADVPIRMKDASASWQGSILIDGVTVPIHGALGMTSVVTLAPRRMQIDVPADAPEILARLPRASLVPCAELRDVTEAHTFEQSSRWTLPASGTVLGRARIALRARNGTHLPTDLVVRTDDRVHAVSLPARKSTATFEVPLARATRTLELSSEEGSEDVLVELRLAFARGRAARTRSASPLTGDDASMDEETALAAIRAASRTLASLTVPPASAQDIENITERRRSAHVERAAALEALGYSRFAATDRIASGTAAGPTRRASTLLTVTSRNLAARMPALPTANAERLAEARSLRERGELERALEVIGEAPAGSAEVFMEAQLHEQLDELDEAADAFVRTETAAGLARAAELVATLGARTNDTNASVRALALATLARQRGASTGAAMGRALAGIEWKPIPAVDETAGTRMEISSAQRPDTSLAQRVRRAWLDAPDDAIFLREGEALTLELRLVEPAAIALTGKCASLYASTPCSLAAAVDDGEQLRFEADRLVVHLEPGRHELSVRGVGEGEALSWLQVRAEESETLLALQSSSLVYEATPRRSIGMTVLAPTVLRMRIASENDTDAVRVFVDGREATRWQAATSGGEPLEIALTDDGAHDVRVETEAGRIRAQILIAVPREAPPNSSAGDARRSRRSLFVGTRRVPAYEGEGTPFAQLYEPGPLSLSVGADYVHATLRDLDVLGNGAPFVELWAATHVRLGIPLALHLGGFTRIREGTESFGGRAGIEASGDGLRPFLSASGQITSQDLDEGLETAFKARLTSAWNAPLSRIWSLQPALTLRFDRVGHLPVSALIIDPDVHTQFYSDHPRGLQARLNAVARPFVDVFVRVGGAALTNADFGSFDRAEVNVQLDSLVGRGIAPWVMLGYTASYRFDDEHRSDSDLRHILRGSLLFWTWWRGTDRISLGAQADWVMNRGDVAFMTGLEYMWSPYRGVHDLAGPEVRFPERLEEGADVSPLLTPNRTRLYAE